MNTVAAYHLRSAAARLLLAGKGGGAVFGYLPQQPAGREQAIALVAELVRQGVVTNTGTALRIEQPLDGWLHTIATAPCVVRLQAPGTALSDCCLYPAADDTIVLCMPRPGHDGQLRIAGVPAAALWALLCEENPLLDLPEFDNGTLPALATAQLTATADPAAIPDLLFCFQLYSDGAVARAAFALRSGPAFALAVTDPAGGPTACHPYRSEALQALLNQWLKGENTL